MIENRSRRVGLRRHPQSDESFALVVDVEVVRSSATLALTYIVRGDIGAVSLPKVAGPARTDGLWQHTCFEAFVRDAQSPVYWEFNFSPSREWAAYRFDDYRAGMAAEPALADPGIELQTNGSELRLSAVVNLSGVAALSDSEDWRLGLSAVFEDWSGNKSYWALVHPSEKPDFHDAGSFALTLSGSE